MATEIERKFLVVGDDWRCGATATAIRQGYLSSTPERTVRIRLEGDRGTITVKGLTRGATRDEFEYAIPAADATEMLDRLCEKPLLEKTRWTVDHGGRTWQIDVFHGENEGLIVAEVELERESDVVALPPWAGREVTGDDRFYNVSLVRRPFRRWPPDEPR